MDAEKSSNSSFEDLSNLNEADIKRTDTTQAHTVLDDEGNVESMASQSSLDSENSNFIAKTTYALSEKNSPNKLKATSNKLIGTESLLTPKPKEIEKSSDSEEGNKTMKGSVSTTGSPTNEDGKGEGESPEDDMVCDVLANGQLVKTILTKSTMQMRPKRGDLVTINYVGKLKDGTVVEEAHHFQLHIGDYEVVQGLDMVIPLMDVKEKARVEVDSRFAYGSLGLKNEKHFDRSIPAGEGLIYEVELLDIKEEDFSDLKSFEIRRQYGTRKKERANFWYNRCEYNIAIQLYRRALDYLDDRDGDPDSIFDKEDLELSNSDLQTLLEDRLIVYNNMAMAQIKISAFDAALKSVETVLRCQPNNSKALYRKGRILEGKGDVKGAISLLQKAATLEPDSKTIQQDLAKLIIKARREEHNEKELYQKMLGQAKKLEMKNKQPQKQEITQNSKAKFLGYLMGSILVGVAGVAIYRYKY